MRPEGSICKVKSSVKRTVRSLLVRGMPRDSRQAVELGKVGRSVRSPGVGCSLNCTVKSY